MATEGLDPGRIISGYQAASATPTITGSLADVDFDDTTIFNAGSFASLSYDVSAVTGTVNVSCFYRNHSGGAWIELLASTGVSAGSLYADVMRGAQIKFQVSGTATPAATISFCLK